MTTETAEVLRSGAAIPGRPVARHSDSYVDDIVARHKGRTASKEVKLATINRILSDSNDGFRRLGVGMIGPIQLKLRYQGITRNVLEEDPVTPGTPVAYDINDDLGQAMVMSGHDGEVELTVFEGRRIFIDFFRIASAPVIRKEDLIQMRINLVEQAQDETKQAILKQEDGYLMTQIAAALAEYASAADHVVTPNHTVVEASGSFTPASLYAAVGQTDMHELQASRILVNPSDYRDFYKWSLNDTGWAFKDRVVAGESIRSFGEFQFQRSLMVPPKTAYLLPNPNFLGVFPVLYSLDVQENHKVANFYRGWVFDEMINFLILNPRGIAAITKP